MQASQTKILMLQIDLGLVSLALLIVLASPSNRCFMRFECCKFGFGTYGTCGLYIIREES